MADANPTPTPAPTPDVQAPIISPSPAPDLGALTQSSQTGPNLLTDPNSPYVQTVNAGQQAEQNIVKASQPTPPPKPQPHAKLIAMVQGLALGLSAAGTAIGTHGAEGGYKEVAEVQGEQQQQKIQAQEAAQAQKNAYIQQQLTVMNTNRDMGQQMLMTATLPNTLTENDLKVKESQLGVLGSAQDIRTKALSDLAQTGDVAAYNNTVSKIGGITGENAAPGAGAATTSSNNVPPTVLAGWKNNTDAAADAYPNDAAIKKYARILADPNATPPQMASASIAASNRMKSLDAGVDSRTKQNAEEAGSLYGKLSTPQALADPGSQAAINAAITDPQTSPTDVKKLIELLPQAFAAQANADAIKKRQAVADEAIKEGDPNAAGQLLANRQTTISELKSRGMTPQFITNSINAALKIDPKYNAVAEDNFAKTAGSEQNQAFFGNVGSLIAPGGTIDQLAEISKGLSQNDLQVLNKVKNWADVEVGEGGVSAAAAKAVGVADDYAKVMGAGVGSDASRAMVLHIIDQSLSPEQRAQSMQAMKDAVKSQADARIGNNPWMKTEYGTLVSPSGGTGAGNGTNLIPGAVVPPGQTIPAGASPLYGADNTVLGYKGVDGKYVKF